MTRSPRAHRTRPRSPGHGRLTTFGTTYTVAEVAEILRVHRTTLYRLVKQANVPGFKVGDNWRISSEALDLLLADRFGSFNKNSKN